VVPKNLVVPIPDNVSYESAAFGALASIALQGIRRLDLTAGERIGVIGLGLIGQLVARLAVLMGYEVFGFDLAPDRVDRVVNKKMGIRAWPSSEINCIEIVQDVTNGIGLDGVIVCASTSSDDVVNLAFELCRVRGRVSIVGDVGLDLERARMYRKELELRLSCSYGPGRYDDNYEIHGQDYPIGYVRWTEQRNLQYFLDLIANERLEIQDLISKSYPVQQAIEAYSVVKEQKSTIYGILLDYDLPVTLPAIDGSYRRQVQVKSIVNDTNKAIRLALIGVGGYAKAVHIPNIRRLSEAFQIYGVASRSGITAEVVAKRCGAEVSTSSYEYLLEDGKVDAVIISTRHASHAKITLDALNAGKHVFVEKPMAITIEDSLAINRLVNETGLVLRVGFNRRFSPYMRAMKQAIGSRGRRLFRTRVNIGEIKNDWSNTEEEGGRLIGEGVHFFDLCNWFFEKDPITVNCQTLGPANPTNPNAIIVLSYPDGDVGEIAYTSLGTSKMGKEYYEAFGNGKSCRMDDFRNFDSYNIPIKVSRFEKSNKGQLQALEEFAWAIRNDSPHSTTGADSYAGMLATWIGITALKSANEGKALPFDLIPELIGNADKHLP
jgi:predicted dehydrogenase/D-arabinose 1-dehydrogenase-like Zn-dependent alcohol dehydrogenase